MTADSQEPKLLALHRYYIWALAMRERFLERVPEVKQPEDIPQAFLATVIGTYMCYWYATLYVVVEGWRDLRLEDEVLHQLVSSPNVDLLRRFRNGVFHFQREYHDEHFFDLLRSGASVVNWVHDLNREFGRYFLERLGASH